MFAWELWFSMGDPWTNSISNSWEIVRNAYFQAPSETYGTRSSKGGAQEFVSISFPAAFDGCLSLGTTVLEQA